MRSAHPWLKSSSARTWALEMTQRDQALARYLTQFGTYKADPIRKTVRVRLPRKGVALGFDLAELVPKDAPEFWAVEGGPLADRYLQAIGQGPGTANLLLALIASGVDVESACADYRRERSLRRQRLAAANQALLEQQAQKKLWDDMAQSITQQQKERENYAKEQLTLEAEAREKKAEDEHKILHRKVKLGVAELVKRQERTLLRLEGYEAKAALRAAIAQKQKDFIGDVTLLVKAPWPIHELRTYLVPDVLNIRDFEDVFYLHVLHPKAKMTPEERREVMKLLKRIYRNNEK